MFLLDRMVIASGLAKAYGRKVLLDSLSFSPPLAYVDQGRELDSSSTVYDEVSGGSDIIQVGKREINARPDNYLLAHHLARAALDAGHEPARHALGVTGSFSVVLVVRELWRARSAKAR